MKSSRIISSLLLCGVTSVAILCSNPVETADEPATCVPNSGYVFPCVKVVFPDGGEVFQVGDSITMLFCSNDTVTCSLVEDEDLQITFDGGTNWYTIAYGPGFQYGWRVPESITVPGTDGQTQTISTVSNNCKIRLHRYNFFGTEFDESDGTFSISAR